MYDLQLLIGVVIDSRSHLWSVSDGFSSRSARLLNRGHQRGERLSHLGKLLAKSLVHCLKSLVQLRKSLVQLRKSLVQTQLAL